MKNQENEIEGLLGDIGGMELPNLNLDNINIVDFLPSDDVEETRYTRPKVAKLGSDYVSYDNAVKMAKELRLDFGQRFDAFVSGNFIFGDFIEAYLTTQVARAKKMTISTLSMNQDNIDSLANLMKGDYIGELNIIISVYFWGNERNSLIPYIYHKLDTDNRFQLAVASVHTKTCQFESEGGRKIVIHGSANLRSSGNIEQFTMEENPELYDFYDEKFSLILDKYATIKKAVRSKTLWNTIDKKKFN